METDQYQKMASRESTNFWYVGRREILSEAISRHWRQQKSQQILDVGCGTGGNLSLLAKYGEVTGVDFSSEALNFAAKTGLKHLFEATATALPFADESYDLVVALDVLEHVQDDEKALKEFFRILKPGGLLLLTVPAYKFLWSNHDEVLHHVRRYSHTEILVKLTNSRFGIVEHTYFVMLGVGERLMKKVKYFLFPNKNKSTFKKADKMDFPKSVNNLLLFILRCEKYLLRYCRLPFGTSILVMAQKPFLA